MPIYVPEKFPLSFPILKRNSRCNSCGNEGYNSEYHLLRDANEFQWVVGTGIWKTIIGQHQPTHSDHWTPTQEATVYTMALYAKAVEKINSIKLNKSIKCLFVLGKLMINGYLRLNKEEYEASGVKEPLRVWRVANFMYRKMRSKKIAILSLVLFWKLKLILIFSENLIKTIRNWWLKFALALLLYWRRM